MLYGSGNQKRTGMTIVISENIDYKSKTIIRDKEGHHIMINRSVNLEDTVIINIYVFNMKVPKYIRQM